MTVIAWSAPTVEAQPIPMSPELKAFLTRPEEQQAFGGMMGKQWRDLVVDCPSPTVQGMNVIVSVPPQFDSTGKPKSGVWRVVGHFQGCGKALDLNVSYQLGPNGQMARILLVPGTTATDLRLQHDALLYAATGMVLVAPKDCKDVKYVDTKFISFDGTTPPSRSDIGKRPWTEEWTVRSCGVTGIVTLHFAPNATGTLITADVSKTRKINP